MNPNDDQNEWILKKEDNEEIINIEEAINTKSIDIKPSLKKTNVENSIEIVPRIIHLFCETILIHSKLSIINISERKIFKYNPPKKRVKKLTEARIKADKDLNFISSNI